MNRIKELRTERNLSQEELGERVGTSGPTIQRLETGKRELTHKWAIKISDALGVELPEIFGKIIPAASQGLKVAGEVQAGVWREVDAVDENKYPPINMGPDPRFPPASQFAVLVQGTSMNRLFPPGSFIVCVEWATVGRDPKDGDIVVVERRRDGMVESTVKKVGVLNKKLVLMPSSTDPRWQDPIELDGDSDREEIAIAGLVVGKYQQF